MYAKTQGEAEAVADAIYDHYRPLGAEDTIPRSTIGQLVAVADKLDTLGGLFRLNLIPTGSKDPFALRRSAYGIIRILIEGKLALSIPELCAIASADHNIAALEEFLIERLRHYMRDVCGFRQDEIQAVLNASSKQPLEVVARTEAISRVRATEDFALLAAGFKRISNILRQAGGVDAFLNCGVDTHLFKENAEKALFDQFEELKPLVASLKEDGQYEEALTLTASLRSTVDSFFNEVMVMTDNKNMRTNRLALLAQLQKEFSTIADFQEIVSSGD
jgi:glycyl-tRNA synthetase beta chain